MTNRMFFKETKPGVFERNKNFHIKNNNFWVNEQYKEIDDFCFKIRDGITNILENIKKNLQKNCLKMNFSDSKKLWI